MNTEFIEALRAHLVSEGKAECDWIHEAATTECFAYWAIDTIDTFVEGWTRSPDNPDNYADFQETDPDDFTYDLGGYDDF